ncbi:tetratricopeptide repeat protein [Magnetospira sp. QH-2]|uniref:tetratricopeptide repeat protein n=1 Tax=Magnetospira sp. (strain QH-2) TaxID=1288970 RepID=UPI00130E885D|nr:tetratricopeptide repeat protein [Magnetospira sp. QH-2]
MSPIAGLALLITACASGTANSEIEAIGPGSSLYGNYLSARHAQSARRPDMASRFFEAVLAEEPDSASLRNRTFVLKSVEGEFDDSLPLAKEMVEAKKASPLAELVLVIEDIHQGGFAEAVARAETVTDKGVNAFLLPMIKAWALAGADKGDAATEELDQLAKSNGFKTLAHLHKALLQAHLGDLDAAESTYLLAMGDGENTSSRMRQLYGAFLERQGKVDEARTLYQTYLEKHPGSRLFETALARVDGGKALSDAHPGPAHGVAEALFDVGNSLRQRNARDTAMLLVRLALRLKPDFPLAQIIVADLLESDDRLAAANEIYRQINPLSHAAWSARMAVASNLDRLDRTDDAVMELRAMARDYPDEADPLISLGDVLRGRDRYAEAVEAYDDALKRIGTVHQDHWSFFYTRGIALEQSQQWDRAEKDFLKALELRPDQPYVLNYLGYSWVERERNLDRARGMIEKAVEAQPTDGYIVDSLGWVLYRFKDYEGAVKNLERAVELRPQDPVINDHLGDAYWQVGRKKEARFQWRRARGLEPEQKVLDRIERKLKSGLNADDDI